MAIAAEPPGAEVAVALDEGAAVARARGATAAVELTERAARYAEAHEPAGAEPFARLAETELTRVQPACGAGR